jgi:hypothetical protein
MSRKPRRPNFSSAQLEKILAATGGHCHVCGEKHDLAGYGHAWEVDHVLAIARLGPNSSDNYLAACGICNGLRWMHKPDAARLIMSLGTAARSEGYKRPKLNPEIRKLRARRLAGNWNRRAEARRLEDAERRKIAAQMERDFIELENRVAERMRLNKELGWREAMTEVTRNRDSELQRLKQSYMILTSLE